MLSGRMWTLGRSLGQAQGQEGLEGERHFNGSLNDAAELMEKLHSQASRRADCGRQEGDAADLAGFSIQRAVARVPALWGSLQLKSENPTCLA